MSTQAPPWRRHSICENCRTPVHTDADGMRGWIHSVTGQYRCVGTFGMAGPLYTHSIIEEL